ncbi:MAG: type 2 isopentenyl-diphosphate Delta-isomerase [Acidaminococcaceae bacterium]|nr:type 2 isopentenyl-diphosphate Delta-isomerase [Acidaminococcaceae bacterium]
MMSREQRKLDHIHYALQLGDGGRSTGLDDVRFLHNCLTPVNPDRVCLTTRIGALELPVPLFIDAITGGSEGTKRVNRQLARVARSAGCAMAVGSQYGAVKEGRYADSYAIVREEYPEGILFANLSALATPEEARAAVAMLDADALEIHLNVAQELCMPEGDRDFASLLDNLSRLREAVTVPVIVKETGCGMAREQVETLQALGFTCFNVAGSGGTSFPAIETARSGDKRRQFLADWGIPTAWSLLDVSQSASPWDTVIASGGLRNGLDLAKALALGADAAGMSANVLALTLGLGVDAAASALKDILADLQDVMVLTGAATIKELRRIPLVFTGTLLDFVRNRGYDVGKERRPQAGTRRKRG